MGCLLSKDKKTEKQEPDKSNNNLVKEKNPSLIKQMLPKGEKYLEATDEFFKQPTNISPRPELPSPFKDTEIDP